MFGFKVAVALVAFYTTTALAAFGLTSDSSSYIVDAGSANPLVYKVSRSNCDITSILYRGRQLQKAGPYSHINSGLGTATVSAKVVGGKYTVVSCKVNDLTHHYVTKSGESIIYMATNVAALPSVGELRFIARLSSSELPNAQYLGATIGGSSSTVEGSDVFIVNGETRSKFYSSERFIDDEVHCIWGSDARACMVIPDPIGYETSAGGPFMRDINTNHVGDRHDIYWYHNSGHLRTEPVRTGLYGPFALSFSRSGDPSKTLDTTFFSELSISGYVPTSGRGYISGTASGVPSGFQSVLHWYNNAAQYWTYANGKYVSPPMKPGTYTMVLYKGEFKIAQQTVTVRQGATTTSDITGSEQQRNTIWRIGEWDGTPKGFRNADKQLRMHPTDKRMSSWGPLTYTVGNDISGFPMAQVMAVNNPTTIKFTVTADQASGNLKIRVGTTLAFASGRPVVTINSWTSSSPAAPTKIDSRGLTRGGYRGYGEVYDWNIPAGTVKAGANTMTIKVISGSSGDAFLSPNFIYDAVELFK